MGLAAPVRHAAARDTLALPFRVPPQEWFSIREAAAAAGMKETFIEELFDAGTQLSGHTHNGGEGKRRTKRIPRVWLVAYLIRTADYTDDSLADALLTCLPHLPAPTLLRLAEHARRLATEKPLSP